MIGHIWVLSAAVWGSELNSNWDVRLLMWYPTVLEWYWLVLRGLLWCTPSCDKNKTLKGYTYDIQNFFSFNFFYIQCFSQPAYSEQWMHSRVLFHPKAECNCYKSAFQSGSMLNSSSFLFVACEKITGFLLNVPAQLTALSPFWRCFLCLIGIQARLFLPL